MKWLSRAPGEVHGFWVDDDLTEPALMNQIIPKSSKWPGIFSKYVK